MKIKSNTEQLSEVYDAVAALLQPYPHIFFISPKKEDRDERCYFHLVGNRWQLRAMLWNILDQAPDFASYLADDLQSWKAQRQLKEEGRTATSDPLGDVMKRALEGMLGAKVVDVPGKAAKKSAA